MLTVFQQGFLQILRAGVTNEKQVLPDGFNADRLYDAARVHHLIGIVYKGALLCGIDTELPVMKKLFLGAIKEGAIHSRQLHEYEELKKRLNKLGVEYMPIKGILIKELYFDPTLRYMNDIDILIHRSDYKQIKKMLMEFGYTFRCESDSEYIWIKRGILNLELHKSLISSQNEDFYGYFGDGWNKAVKKGEYEYGLKDEDEFIYIFCHFAKHYRYCGVGAKYIVDLLMYRKNKNLDFEYVERELDKIGVLEFYRNIEKVIDCWFNGDSMDEKTEFISNFILISGAYGSHHNEIASLVLQKKVTRRDFGTSSKVKLFVMRTFPTLSVMRVHYKYLEKCRFLLPFAWVHRWLRTLIKKRKNIAKHLRDIKSVNDNDVENLRKNLEYVGLGFNLKR